MRLPEVSVSPSETSYFSAPSDRLDPEIFDGQRMRPDVRDELHGLVMGHLAGRFRHPERWARAWLAGSGASYQWSAHRDPGDLDLLVGMDYPAFRQHNPQYTGLSDTEISRHVTQGFREHLQPRVNNWRGHYEVTAYVNPHSTDIRAIHPYAAYDLGADSWTVPPAPGQRAEHDPAGDFRAQQDASDAQRIAGDYNEARQAYLASRDPARRINAHRALMNALQAGSALFEEIHHGRRAAFGDMGSGYSDPANYRWQAGKETGAVGALRQMADVLAAIREDDEISLYHRVLPSASDATIAALLHEDAT